jgi:hypothetical protein
MPTPNAAATPATRFWGRIDGIVAINLDERPDRWDQMCANTAPHLVGGPPLTRISAVRGTALPGYGQRPWFRGKASDKRWAARAGCTQSHRKAMALARSQGWHTFLVLEDDVDFGPLATLDFAALDRALFASQLAWDVCYLGFSKAVGTALELTSFAPHRLCEVSGCYTTHAYLVRGRARDWIYSQLADDAQAWAWHAQHRIIDRWYVRHLSQALTVLAVTPSLMTQVPGFSDIVQRQVDYADEFSGQLDCCTRSRARFLWRKWLRNTLMPLADCYDGLRGIVKRSRGF